MASRLDHPLIRLCPVCDKPVRRDDYDTKRRSCKDCVSLLRTHNHRDPVNQSCRDYLRTLTVPELLAYSQGALGAQLHTGGTVVAELRVICDRLEWVAESLIVAGVDGWFATYGGLLTTSRAPRP